MYVPLEFPPGVYRNGTDLQSAGRWRDANLVRWIDGTLRPVGGWSSRASVSTYAPRGAIAWVENGGNRWIAVGDYEKLYAISEANAVTDITPSGLTTGTEDATLNLGYGGGTFGTGFFGTARTDNASYTDPTTWSMDLWGQELIACSDADGTIYQWDLNTLNAAAAVTNAPTSCLAAMVTEERFLFALGASGNPRKVAWSDREANTTWTAASTNEAGDFTLQTQGKIMQGLRVRGQALILTDVDAHTATYQGPPFVYGFERVGTACGAISRHAAVSVEGGAFWMGARSFFTYAGGSVTPVPCDVSDYVFSRLNRTQKAKVYAVANTDFGEIWWFYPSATENDSYVSYNYREGHWSIGSIARTCGVDRGSFEYPIWFDDAGVCYDHETGYNYESAEVYAETGPLGFDGKVVSVNKMIPDEKTQGDVTATFKTRLYPNGTETEHGPYTMANPTSVRFTGRQVRMRVTGSESASWRVGVQRINVEPRGMR